MARICRRSDGKQLPKSSSQKSPTGYVLSLFNSSHLRNSLPLITRHFSLASFLLLLFASGVFSAASTPNVGSKSDQAKAASPGLPSSAKQGLDFSVGTRGLESLSLNGQSLLLSPQGGELQPSKSVFRTALDFLLPGNRSSGATANKQTNSIDLADRWGHVSCAYGKLGNTLTMRIEVSNTSGQGLDDLTLRLMELNFPSVPDGGTLEAGMFGFGFKGPEWPLDQSPPSIRSVSGPQTVVPIVSVNYRTGVLKFWSDDLECSVSVPYSTNSPARTSYPFMITCHDIKPGVSKTFNVSLRFGPAGARVQDLSGDVLQRYAERYPLQVNCNDRRPIGAMLLASSGINVATNPRRWILNEGKIDITTGQGKDAFRTALLNLADNGIKVMKDANA